MSDTIIDHFFQCVVDGDTDGAIKLTTDDVTFEVQGPASVPIYGKFHGHDGARKFFATLRELLDTEAFAVHSTLANDQIAFGYGTMQHRVKQTGRLFLSEWALYCVLFDGKISHYRIFEDTAALAAAYVNH